MTAGEIRAQAREFGRFFDELRRGVRVRYGCDL
jgi:hypothetical protein